MKIETGMDLRKFRKEFHLSESELASLIGCTKKQIATCEYKHPNRKLPKWLMEKLDLNNGIQGLIQLLKPKKKTIWERIKELVKKL